MMRLKSTNQCPPNGWLYTQRETGWVSHLVNPSSQWDYNLLCNAILEHRRANPNFKLSANLTLIKEEVMRVNSARVAMIPNSESYLMDVGNAAPTSFPAAPIQSLQQLAVVGANLKTGKDILFDWEESGQPPVSQEVANKRAETCVRCPKNGSGSLTRYFTIPVAALIKSRLERLHEMKMITPADAQLGVCDACTCPMRLKCWTPLEFIVKHMSEDVKAKLDAKCWILSEEKEQKFLDYE